MRKFREPKHLFMGHGGVAIFFVSQYPAQDMSPYLHLLTGRRNAHAWEIVDLRGRVLNRSTVNPLAWGPTAAVESLRETAATIVYHSGVKWPGMAVVERFALEVVTQFDPQYGFSIADTEVAAWLSATHEETNGR